VRLFATRPEVRFADAPRDGRTVVELTAGDRPGLLCDVGRVFDHYGVRVHAARITTVGERAEDVFYVTDLAGQPLTDAGLRSALAATLHERLAPPA
jgi:[protein-PII] uridylyltransferase